jgi:hypothetical protein
MAEGKGKYGGLLSEIRNEQVQAKPPAVLPVLIPAKPPAPAGKRSDPAYIQKGVFLRKETIQSASERLSRRGDKTDFSDLLQALLVAWLASPE